MTVHRSPASSFKSQIFLEECQDSAFNKHGGMGEITHAGGIKM